MTPKELKALLELMQTYHLAELEIERSGLRIKLRRETAVAHPSPSPAVASSLPLPVDVHPTTDRRPTDSFVPIEAPMVGTFYRAPAPEAPPYVKEGDLIKEGQVLCIIEAMKLMNEIESKVGGRLVKILVENSHPVEYGQPLFLVEPQA